MTDQEKQRTWSLYYLTTVGWTMHPGYLKTPGSQPSLAECARIADRMMAETEARCPQSGEQ